MWYAACKQFDGIYWNQHDTTGFVEVDVTQGSAGQVCKSLGMSRQVGWQKDILNMGSLCISTQV